MGTSSRYQLELDELSRRRQAYHPPRQRDDEAGFVGQASYGSQDQDRAVDPDEDLDVDSDDKSPEDSAKADEFGDLFDAIIAGTAPDAILARATKCAMDCARMTGRPVAQFLTDAARSIAVSEIYGD